MMGFLTTELIFRDNNDLHHVDIIIKLENIAPVNRNIPIVLCPATVFIIGLLFLILNFILESDSRLLGFGARICVIEAKFIIFKRQLRNVMNRVGEQVRP